MDGPWIDRHENLLITGPTGLGKSWIACALGHKACRAGRPVAYRRVPRLFEALAIAKGDGRHARLLKSIAMINVLILDDWRIVADSFQTGARVADVARRHGPIPLQLSDWCRQGMLVVPSEVLAGLPAPEISEPMFVPLTVMSGPEPAPVSVTSADMVSR